MEAIPLLSEQRKYLAGSVLKAVLSLFSAKELKAAVRQVCWGNDSRPWKDKPKVFASLISIHILSMRGGYIHRYIQMFSGDVM